jgi:site-specific DNA-methyltransferase (adenine-specific)
MLIQLLLGDCRVRLALFTAGSIREVCCDPPYGLEFMGKDFDKLGDGALQQAWHKLWLAEVFRVLPPGGRLQAFGGSRVYHRMAAAMEDVGFVDIQLDAWAYGSGFPKSLNLGKAMDKHLGVERKPKRVPFTGNALLRSGGQNTRPWMEEALKKGYHELPGDVPESEEAKKWDGWGTAQKPAWEPVVIGRKPEQGLARSSHA